MRKNYKTILIPLVVILLTGLLYGCGGGGVSQQSYDYLKTKLEAAQSQIGDLQGEINDLREENEDIDARLKAAQLRVAEMESQAGVPRKANELVGETPAETAANIVRHYHETHTYSTTDFFVCADMAADVWNMLKTYGIAAVIQVGNVETGVGDLVDSNHSWVVAEVAPGQNLALETTSGRVVTREENALYYRGWSFPSPKEYKRYAELRREYNVRVDIIVELQEAAKGAYSGYQEAVDEYNRLVDEFNSKYFGNSVTTESQLFESGIEAQQEIVDEKEARYLQLQELIDSQELTMYDMIMEMNALATLCGG